MYANYKWLTTLLTECQKVTASPEQCNMDGWWCPQAHVILILLASSNLVRLEAYPFSSPFRPTLPGFLSFDTTMSLSHHHLSPDELHQPFPQLDGEEEDPSNPSVSDRVDPRIRWIYFGFGCVLLLPWNCAKLLQLWFHVFTYWPLLIPSINHCYSIFRLPVKRVFISINLRIVPIILLYNRQFSFVDILDSHICTGMTSMLCAPTAGLTRVL